ncbi:hypothetical protein ACS2TZ_49660, partial [Bacillus cereus group sp. Bce025]
VDSFASYPFGIDDELLIKALSMCTQNLDFHAVYSRILGLLKVVNTTGPHELIELSERLTMPVAFLLLKNQTVAYGNVGNIKLKLRQTINDK